MVVLGLALVVVIYVMLTYDPRTRLCRWRKDRSRNRATEVYWVCDYCGAETFTEGERPDFCAREGR